MRTVQKSLRIPHDIANTIKDMADAVDRDFSTVVNELLITFINCRLNDNPSFVYNLL